MLTEANEEIQLKGDLTPVRRKVESRKDGANEKKKRSTNVSNAQDIASESKAGGLSEKPPPDISVSRCH